MTWFRQHQPSLADAPRDTMPIECWLVFWPVDATHRFWWTRWVDPKLAHVNVYVQDGDRWLVLDHRLDYLDARVVGVAREPLDQVLPPGWTLAVHVRRWRPLWRMRLPWVLGPVTCVELCKHLLGVRGFWTISPRQLLDELHALGALTGLKFGRT